MPSLSWNEIKARAVAFSRDWSQEGREHAEAKTFWDEFFAIFGVSRRRVASFEAPVKLLGSKRGSIDLFWKGKLLVEHKSLGKNLDAAYAQATNYFEGIKEEDLPRFIVVSDFQRFRLYDLEGAGYIEFQLKDLPKHVRRFGFIAGYQTEPVHEQDPVNLRAAERMGKLHDRLQAVGYEGHDLEVYLVRLLFCLFAEDTSIFEPTQFRDLIEQRTQQDGSDLADRLATLFEVLNTPPEKRLKNLDEQMAAFPYVNGKLFEERLSHAQFDSETRNLLLQATAVDWSKISPAIFGAMFQSVMDRKARRNLGAHYTSESNILKVINPLFMDGLRTEFARAKGNRKRVEAFHEKLSKLTFFDPACGCGNFLVIAYRELRLLELEVLETLFGDGAQAYDIGQIVRCEVDQFYGIELEEFPAQIAQVALWLIDHQMNLKVSEAFGQYYIRLPLRKSATIIHGNALRLDWASVLPASNCDFLMGNPPFVGAMVMNDDQRRDMDHVFGSMKGAGVLDYVAAWYKKAAEYIRGTSTRCAFVSTNSITQGEQVGILWRVLLDEGIHIDFAHRTFSWSSEAKGKAAVHCVIIGFSRLEATPKILFDYDDVKGEPHKLEVTNINPYLVDAPNILLTNRSRPICPVPPMRYGNMPRDGGNLLLTPEEKIEIETKEPEAKPYIRLFLGAQEFLNAEHRYCLWLQDMPPDLLRRLTLVRARVEAVKKFRLASKAASTRRFAATPALFCQISQPTGSYILVPRHASENRDFIPLGFLGQENIVADSNLCIPDGTAYQFGVLHSTMHMAWVRAVCGRLESRYRYSKDIVYNNFPWPESHSVKKGLAIVEAAEGVLKIRKDLANYSLADLYDPISMPAALQKAHQALDRAVDLAYQADGGKTTWSSDAERVAFLFERYQKITSPLISASKTGRQKGAKARSNQ